jgi:basic membrane lipoprotein Med (substrate-binding protein (PBP1-ABC) superfamily)
MNPFKGFLAKNLSLSALTFLIVSTLILTFSLTPLIVDKSKAANAIKYDRSKKIALLYDAGGVGDNSYNDAANEGLKVAIKKYKLFAPNVRTVVTDGTLGDRIYRLQLMARNGYNLLIAVGSANAKAVERVAFEFPDIEYALLNDGTISGVNVASLVYDERQEAYMAGFIGALLSRSKEIVFIGSNKAEVDRLGKFFLQGVNAAGNNVSVVNLTTAEKFGELISSQGDIVYSTWSQDSSVLNQIILLNRERSRADQLKLIARQPDQYFTKLQIAKPHILFTIERDVTKAIDLVIWGLLTDTHVLSIVDSKNNIFGKRFSFANGGLKIKFENKVSVKKRERIIREIEKLKQKEIKF